MASDRSETGRIRAYVNVLVHMNKEMTDGILDYDLERLKHIPDDVFVVACDRVCDRVETYRNPLGLVLEAAQDIKNERWNQANAARNARIEQFEERMLPKLLRSPEIQRLPPKAAHELIEAKKAEFVGPVPAARRNYRVRPADRQVARVESCGAAVDRILAELRARQLPPSPAASHDGANGRTTPGGEPGANRPPSTQAGGTQDVE